MEVSFRKEVVVADITYIRLGKGSVYSEVVMDVYTRGIRGWALFRFLNNELTLEALERALSKGVPEIHHSDQGVQYTAEEYAEFLEKHRIKISMASKRRPDQNGYCERPIRMIVKEEGGLSEYKGFWDARARIGGVHRGSPPKKTGPFSAGVSDACRVRGEWHRKRKPVGSLSKMDEKEATLGSIISFP